MDTSTTRGLRPSRSCERVACPPGDGWFAGAVRRAQKVAVGFLKLSQHDLRHTAASLAISTGANVKAVQRMLGHGSASMTLDTYADLFDDDLDNVAIALGDARSKALPPAPN